MNDQEDAIPTKSKKPAAKSAPKKAAKPKSAKPAKNPAKSAAAEAEHKLYDLIMKALDQEKGENVVSIDLKGKTAIADYMVIVTGTSARHVGAIAEKIRDRISKEGFKSRIEGKGTGDWVILDAGDVIVHLFRAEVREFYNLEKLWGSDFSTVGYNLYTS